MCGVMGGDGMRQGRTRGRHAMTGLATLLVLLLMLHHPSMGLMPMTPTAGLSGHGLAAAASSVAMPMGSASRAGSVARTQDAADCSCCAMTCPLMDGITPHRSALRSPTPHRAGHVAWPPTAAAVVTPTLAYAAHNLVVGVTEHIPAQRTRRAILQVYLL